MLELSKEGYLLFYMCHERSVRRRSKWIQALITLHRDSISLKQICISRIPLLNVVSAVDENHTLNTAFATEAYTLSSGPEQPISVPVSKQLGSVSGRGLETPPTVSDHGALMIVVTNYWSLAYVCSQR